MKKERDSLKSVKIELIPEQRHGKQNYPYRVLDKMRKHHGDIHKAKIALAWVKQVKPDKDGHILLGRCHKSTDLEKELQHYDFVILLNKDAWNEERFTKKMKYALVDHELCHAAAVYAKSGKQKKDEKGRYCFRTRHHDVEEFYDIVKRHGIWKHDLEIFAKELLKRRRRK